MFHRLFNTPLSQKNFIKERDIIFYIAESNGFPKKIIYKVFHKHRLKQLISQSSSLTPTIKKPKTHFRIPFLGYTSIKIRKAFRSHDIGISFSTISNLRTLFSHLKDEVPENQLCGVYRINCSCQQFYLGLTTRNFSTRILEHTNEIKKRFFEFRFDGFKSTFAEHVIRNGHIHFHNDFEVVITDRNKSMIETLEAYLITLADHFKEDELINEQRNFQINPIFKQLLLSNNEFNL